MSLEDVLARSRQRTRMTERRRFTVAADKAFDKQKQFAMKNPQDWVLRAFQAAVFSRAELVGMDTRKSQVTIGWLGGVGVLPDQLDDLFHYLMTDRTAAATRHLSQLALAVVGALASKPAEVRIESIGSGQPVCMIIDEDGQARVGEPSTAIDGTYITVLKYRSIFSRFQGVSASPEVDRLWSASRFSPVPLLVNPCTRFEYTRFPYVDRDADLNGAEGGRRWTLWRDGVHPEFTPNTLTVVVGGVTVEHVGLPGLGMQGVVCDDRLRLSADQSRVARGARWAELLHDLVPRIHARLDELGLPYHPIDLPERGEAESTEVVAAPEAPTEPVGDVLPTVGPRPDLVTPRGVGEPVLYVLPDDVEEMAEDLDPYVLPIQVAVLREPQAETLRRTGRPAHRVTAGAGLAFVRRMAVADEVLATSERKEGGLTLRLRLHLGDSKPPWGLPHAPLPLVVRHGGRTRHCTGLGVELPGCSVVVEGTEELDRAVDLVHRWAVEAALDLVTHDSEEARTLARHLVVHTGIPTLVDRDGTVALDLLLPEALDAVRNAELVEGRTVQDLLGLAGTPETLRVDDVEAHEALERLIGVGHLVDEQLERTSLLAIGYGGRGWRPVERYHDGAHRQVLAILPTFSTATVPTDKQRLDLPPPLVGLWRKEPRGDWAEGAASLLDLAEEQAASDPRLEALLPVVRPALLRLQGRRGDDLVPPGGPWREAVAAGGLGKPPHQVLPLTVDAYHALLPDVRLPLHLDDPSDVWSAPDRHEWVVRLPVEMESLDGWVGLRRPFDPTSGVLLQRGDGRAELLADYAERFPAHGWLRGRSDGFRRLLPGLQLYRSLVIWLADHPDDEDARAYARQLVLTDPASPLVPSLAPYVSLTSGQTLEAWLAMDITRRPAVPDEDEPFESIPTAVGASRWVERVEAAVEAGLDRGVSVRGLRAKGDFGSHARVRSIAGQRIRLDVYVLGGDSVFREPRLVEVLLLDAMRAVQAEVRKVGFDFSMVRAVEVLSAGR